MTTKPAQSFVGAVRQAVSRLLDIQRTIRQLIYLGIIAAVVVLVPYFTIGGAWAITHQDHLQSVHGLDKLFSELGEIVAWPVLIIADVTLK